jgi:hypothetical protein
VIAKKEDSLLYYDQFSSSSNCIGELELNMLISLREGYGEIIILNELKLRVANILTREAG